MKIRIRNTRIVPPDWRVQPGPVSVAAMSLKVGQSFLMPNSLTPRKKGKRGHEARNAHMRLACAKQHTKHVFTVRTTSEGVVVYRIK